MAITSSAKKAIRSSARKRVFNLRRRHAMTASLKHIRRLLSEGKAAEARKYLPNVYQAFDKARKTKYLKKNTVARMKSRIALLVNKAT